MKRNCRQRAAADLAFAMFFKIQTTHVSCEERNTLRCFDSREPDKRQSARVHHAIFRCNANFNDLLGFQAIQQDKSARPSSLMLPSECDVLVVPPFSFSRRQAPQFPSFQLLS